jgi:hypothetical protein
MEGKQTLKFRLQFNGKTIKGKCNPVHDELIKKVLQLCNMEPTDLMVLKFMDAEKDLVTLGNQSDVDEARRLFPRRTLQLVLVSQGSTASPMDLSDSPSTLDSVPTNPELTARLEAKRMRKAKREERLAAKASKKEAKKASSGDQTIKKKECVTVKRAERLAAKAAKKEERMVSSVGHHSKSDKTWYEECLKLEALGFSDKKLNRKLLNKTNGDLDRATAKLEANKQKKEAKLARKEAKKLAKGVSTQDRVDAIHNKWEAECHRLELLGFTDNTNLRPGWVAVCSKKCTRCKRRAEEQFPECKRRALKKQAPFML